MHHRERSLRLVQQRSRLFELAESVIQQVALPALDDRQLRRGVPRRAAAAHRATAAAAAA